MPHFGVLCPPIAGHVNPLAAVGRALVRRGHRVTLFHVQDMEAAARAEGLQFEALGHQDYPVGALAQSVLRLSNLSGMAALRYSIECSCRISNLILRDGPGVMRRQKIDALLVDQNEPSGGTVAEHLGIPFLSVCTSLPLNREPLIPPPFAGWKFIDSTLARVRNRIGYSVVDYLIAPIQELLNKYRKNWVLRQINNPNDTFSQIASIAQMPREFDFPRRQLPGTFHYLGPWFDDKSSSGIPFPFEKLDGRPIVYGSIGTLQSKTSRYFQIMAEACSGLHVQLVMSLGHGTGEAGLHLPGNPVVVNYAPQLELLARAAVTITHAGMNTTMQSLHFGVPAIAIPLAHDQPAIAARLLRTGAGIVIPPARLTPSHLRSAVQSLLPEASEFRGRARRLQEAIAKSGGVERAADIAEQLLEAPTRQIKTGAS
jgi:zeaxanthin glucosyltransferase